MRLQRVPQGRFGAPSKDMDGVAVFLASDAAFYVTGHLAGQIQLIFVCHTICRHNLAVDETPIEEGRFDCGKCLH